MARVTPGPLVGSIAGKVGGVVFRGAGDRARVQAAPITRRARSLEQMNHAAAFASCTALWSSLDAEARLCWHEFARQKLPPANVHGRAPVSGRAAFVQFRMAVLACGLVPSYDWPSVYPYYPPARYQITATTAPAPEFLLYMAGFGLTSGITLYVAPCTAVGDIPSRPAWRPVFVGSRDGAPAWVDLSPDPDWQAYVDLTAYFAANVPEAGAGQNWAARATLAQETLISTPPVFFTFAIS